MKRILAICMAVLLFSCTATTTWKTNYVQKQVLMFKEKYTPPQEFKVSFSCPGSKSFFEEQTKKEVRRTMRCYEKSIATLPDSITVSGNKTDSFYHNKNKITYIEKNALLTPGKHLIK